ncbi:MAG: sensor histidine kinase [Acidimicrobiales bacterium]
MGSTARRANVVWWAVVVTSASVAALGVAALAAGGPNENPYSWSQFAIGASCVAVGGFVARRRPDHPLGWLVVTAGAAVWTTFAGVPGIAWLIQYRPGWETFIRGLLHLGVSGWIVSQSILIALVPLAFPDGFLRTVWRRALLVSGTVTTAAWATAHSMLYTPEYFQGQPATGIRATAERWENTFAKGTLIVAVLAMSTMVWSTVRAERPERRRQAGFAVATVALLLPTFLDLFHGLVHELPRRLVDDSAAVQVWALAVAPAVLAVGILRHHLLDIQVIVRRATFYAAVVATGAAIYLGTVWVVATVRPGSDVVPAVIGSGVVAVSLGLVRDRLNRWLARRLFGTRDDPFGVVRALGSSIEGAPASEHALQTVTDTLCAQLRLPFARAELLVDDEPSTVAITGTPTDDAERFPLSHQGVMLGELVIGRRAPGEPLTGGERDIVSTLARQAGVLAHNVTLVEALRRSRLVLVNAREEERRRIRADLHDGLGPTLATVAMGLEATARRLDGEPELESLLQDLERELQGAIQDVRALVYELRPAALDDLGLVSAVREYARTLAQRSAATSHPLDVVIDAPEAIGPLPAAVEVAAYRVALEALTNVARHAEATHCAVRLSADDGLALTVEDDGIGLRADNTPGIGLASMRERVAELEGRFHVGSRPGRGTIVSAWFPVAVMAVE